MSTHRLSFTVPALLTSFVVSPTVALADDHVRLEEGFAEGAQCHVSCRVEVSGTLMPEPENGKTSKPLALKGESAIEYDERILRIAPKGEVQKTLRIYRRIDFQRKVGDREQQQTIRPAVRRLVLLRHNNTEVPFSPDGPLTWGEIDLV